MATIPCYAAPGTGPWLPYLVMLYQALAHGRHVPAPAGAGPVVELLVGCTHLRLTPTLTGPAYEYTVINELIL